MRPYLIVSNRADFINNIIESITDSKFLLENQDNLPFNFYYIKPEDSKKTVSIKQIQDAQDFIYSKPVNALSKYLIIDSAEKLTIEAQNSLLKVLEEPPEYLTIFLIADSKSKLLKTILSRVIVFTDYYSFENYEKDNLELIKEATWLLQCNQSERLDWLEQNKLNIKDRHYSVRLLKAWLITFHYISVNYLFQKNFINSNDATVELSIDNLKRLQKTNAFIEKNINLIISNNLNPEFFIEVVLFNKLDSRIL